MNSQDIQVLSQYLPSRPVRLEIKCRGDDGTVPSFTDPDMLRYLDAYSDPKFGWRLARDLAAAGKGFPEVSSIDEEWPYRAWLYCLDNVKFRDRAVQGAVALTTPKMQRSRETINALLICDGADTEKIAGDLGMDHSTVEAYAQLFFNVIGRRKDAAWLAEVVYPDSRLPELMQDYLRNEDLGMLLLRMGYNGSTDDILYFAGFRTDSLKKLQTSTVTANNLEAAFMAHAYILARNGLINQNIPAVRDARNLIAAAKQGGGDSGSQSPIPTSVGRSLLAEIKNAGRN